jgi:hypothetical protein
VAGQGCRRSQTRRTIGAEVTELFSRINRRRQANQKSSAPVKLTLMKNAAGKIDALVLFGFSSVALWLLFGCSLVLGHMGEYKQ